MDMGHTSLWRFRYFVGTACVLHLLLLPFIGKKFFGEHLSQAHTERRVGLVSLEGVASHAQKAKQAHAKLEKALLRKNNELKGQIVDIPPSKDNTPPEHARYLSEYNTRTKRETKSRHQAQTYENVMNERTVTHKSDTSNMLSPEDSIEIGVNTPSMKQSQNQNKSGGGIALEIPMQKRQNRLALKLDPELGTLNNQQEQTSMSGSGNKLKLSFGKGTEKGAANKKVPSLMDLIPSVGVLAKLSGAPSNDYLEDVEEGDGTFLNSREFKYASFFNRLKRNVSQHWRPLQEYRRRDPTGHVYGHRSRSTLLHVELYPDGKLKHVSVQKSCGLEFLDAEAIAAFQRAQPFLNPPPGLVSDGQIVFPFGFYIQFAQSNRMYLPF